MKIDSITNLHKAITAYKGKTRQSILSYIESQGECNVRDILDNVKYKGHILRENALSAHLAVLRKHKFVTSRPQGRKVFYSVNNAQIDKLRQVCASY